MQKDADAEADVYNHLANFFGRYYTEGDFISQRRYSGGGRSAYLIPYDGEEVKLHWANADQYYVKTTENYASYVFSVDSSDPPRRVRFEITAADNEKDNVKEAAGRQRRFVLAAGKAAITVDAADLIVRFEHRPLTDAEKKRWPGNGDRQQVRINHATVERVRRSLDPDWHVLLAAPAPTPSAPDRTLIRKHVERYTAKNSFDYFIHKDLRDFLRRELDLYLNTDVLNLDDLDRGDAARLDRALARVRATRHVGRKIIDFLAQLEDFQKRLWLKKKFVLETHWCVTLDRVPDALYPEVAANAAQRREWVGLYAVDEITGDLTNGNVPVDRPAGRRFFRGQPVPGRRHTPLRPGLHRPPVGGPLRCRPARRTDRRPARARRELPGAASAAGPVSRKGEEHLCRPAVQYRLFVDSVQERPQGFDLAVADARPPPVGQDAAVPGWNTGLRHR